ncbi:MAG: hypothetical protein JHC33_03975 [Ignisphaera sp.]|nr:hypothetical protein [Ignisphaera sp.]
MAKSLLISDFVRLVENLQPNLTQLANEFVSTQDLQNTEGKCAKMAEAFSKFLTQKQVPNQIIDARNYKGPLKTVGNSNHVLAAVNGYYVDFTAKQFDPFADNIIIDSVDNLRKNWGIVNMYKDYSDFYNNFSKSQR